MNVLIPSYLFMNWIVFIMCSVYNTLANKIIFRIHILIFLVGKRTILHSHEIKHIVLFS